MIRRRPYAKRLLDKADNRKSLLGRVNILLMPQLRFSLYQWQQKQREDSPARVTAAA